MGQDFIEKRNDQFRRCREKIYEESFRSPNLFSNVLPTEEVEFFGILVCADLAEEDMLWHSDSPENTNGGELRLYRGATEAVRLDREAAAAIQDLEEQSGNLAYLVVNVDLNLNTAKFVPLKPNMEK